MKVTTYSNSGPICILLHGFPNSHRIWDNQIHAMKEQYHVIAIDLPGTDKSSDQIVPVADLNFDVLMDELKTVIKMLNAQQPQSAVYLVAHDMGCFFAHELATATNLRIDGQILINGKGLVHYLSDASRPNQFFKSVYVWILQFPFVPFMSAKFFGRLISKLIYSLSRIPKVKRPYLFQDSRYNGIMLYRSLFKAAWNRLNSSDKPLRQVRTTLIQSLRDPFLRMSDEQDVVRHYGRSTQIHSVLATHWSPFIDSNLITNFIQNQLQDWELCL